ncbi:MAG: hypothetical protein MUP58_00895 [Candidatus Nanohaloarchaeota archaeon QJJ-9]|nr:hypothetical protein [Candidatus Nanohaloarchaeota archaeon QJJ-9]
MEINIRKLLKEVGIAVGLGSASWLLGGTFGTPFILYLAIIYLSNREQSDKGENFK